MAQDDVITQALLDFDQAEGLFQQGNYAAAQPLYEQALLVFGPQLEQAHDPQLLQRVETCLSALSMIATQNTVLPEQITLNGQTWFSQLMHAWNTHIQMMYYLGCSSEVLSSSISQAGLTQLRWIVQQLGYQHGQIAADDPEYQARQLEDQAWQIQDNPLQAQQLLQQALALREQHYGAQHLGHISVLAKQTKLAAQQGQAQQVSGLYQRMAQIVYENVGEQHMLLNAVLLEYMQCLFATQQPIDPSLELLMHRTFGSDMLRSLKQMGQLSQPELPDIPNQIPLSSRQQAIYAEIDTIDWQALEQFDANAKDLPEVLRSLVSEDLDEQTEAAESLYYILWHNEKPKALAAELMPFFWRMLEIDDQPEQQQDLLVMLTAFAISSRSAEPPNHYQAIRQALLQGVPILLRLLQQDDQNQSAILSLLGMLPEAREQIVPRLTAWLEQDVPPGTQAMILLALADLLEYDQASLAFFQAQWQKALHPIAAFVVAVALTARQGPATDEQVIDALLAWLRQQIGKSDDMNNIDPLLQGVIAMPPEYSNGIILDLFTHMFEQAKQAAQQSGPDYLMELSAQLAGPFWQERGLHSGVAVLAQLGPQRATPLFNTLLPELPNTQMLVYTMLKMVFAEPQDSPQYWLQTNYETELNQWAKPLRDDLPQLSSDQQAILLVVLKHLACWQLPIANHPLRWFGLPAEPALLRHMALQTPSASAPPQIPAHLLNPLPIKQLTPQEADLRYKEIGRALRKNKWVKFSRYTYDQIMTYLEPQVNILDQWQPEQFMTNLSLVEHEQFPILSDGEHLDSLDLKILELYVLNGQAGIIIQLLATQKRLAQAFAHLKYLQQHYPTVSNLREPMRPLALARAPLVQNSRPTPLGWLLLADFPQRLYQTLDLRDRVWNPEYTNSADLIDLLMAHPQPYVQEALDLLHYHNQQNHTRWF